VEHCADSYCQRENIQYWCWCYIISRKSFETIIVSVMMIVTAMSQLQASFTDHVHSIVPFIGTLFT